MSTGLSTTLKKLESVSETNRIVLHEFSQCMLSKDHKSERNIISLLELLLAFDRFHGSSFTSINSKEQILSFLNHRWTGREWVQREHDHEGKWITSWNYYLGLLRTFFRWLYNRHKSDDEEWETPAFLKIKTKKPLRDSPYDVSDIWELEDLLTILPYEPELRNKAIITLLWDLDARPHEITSLRVRDIVLHEQYGEGNIPANTKTGGGPILLTSSFTYVRDWINKHPFQNERDARLISNLYTGKALRPDAVWEVLEQLRLRIKRLVEGDNLSNQKRQKLEHLLRKRWNPYCFRHSAITTDSDHLPEYALKKKVRWSMNSQQGKRYIKHRMGDELKNKILEHHGIKILDKHPKMVSRTCGRCGHVNSLQNKYCESKGCNNPLTQEALDELKAAEDAKTQELVNKSNLERDNRIQGLQQELKSLQKHLQDMKMLELRRLKDLVYGRKKFEQEVVKEMELGKDFGTVLSQKLDPDVMMSHIKNDKKIPRIHREVILEDLLTLKKQNRRPSNALD